MLEVEAPEVTNVLSSPVEVQVLVAFEVALLRGEVALLLVVAEV